jgi:hypothetical protein
MNDQTLEYRIATAFKLPPKLAEMLTGLYTRTWVPTNEIDALLMHRLRKEMKPRGVVINTKRMLGYWIEDQDKLVIRRAIGQES